MPQISVIMSVYKEPKEYLVLSIESILYQTFSDFEYIIVIDDPDNNEAIKLIEAYSKKDSRIIVLKNEINIGLTSSLNRALEKSSGKFIARMDADDISDKNRFEKQLRYLSKNSLDLVGCSLRRISETGTVITKIANRSYCEECISEILLLADCIAHPSWFAKRSLFIKLDGYRDIYSCEDYDFLLRALHSGAKLGICDEILISYRINTKGISRENAFRQYLTTRFLRKNYNCIESINLSEIDELIKKKNKKLSALLYAKSLQIFNKGMDSLKQKRILGSIRLFYAPFVSLYIIDKYCKLYQIHKIKKKYIDINTNNVC